MMEIYVKGNVGTCAIYAVWLVDVLACCYVYARPGTVFCPTRLVLIQIWLQCDVSFMINVMFMNVMFMNVMFVNYVVLQHKYCL